MGSLIDCITLADLHPVEVQNLKDAAKAYREEGLTAGEANKKAVKAAIRTLEAERRDVLGQVKKQIPEYFKKPKEIEKPKPEVKERTVFQKAKDEAQVKTEEIADRWTQAGEDIDAMRGAIKDVAKKYNVPYDILRKQILWEPVERKAVKEQSLKDAITELAEKPESEAVPEIKEEKPKKPVAEVPVKEPWEMTAKELANQEGDWYKENRHLISRDKFAKIGIDRAFVKKDGEYYNILASGDIGTKLEKELYDSKIKQGLESHEYYIRKALKSGELTPEKYAELHEKDYGPLAEFMPEAVKKPKITKPEIILEEKPTEKYAKFLESVGYRLRSEEIGQDILDTLQETDISPTDVSTRFWKKIYPSLPKKLQKTFENYLYKLTNMKPGDPIATKNGETIYSESWQDIAEDFLPDKIEHLEGPERGYVALMTDAVNRFAKLKVVPKPKKEPFSEIKSRLLENIKSEKGSSELINDLSRLGADAMRRGHTTYKTFTAEMKTELSSVWEKIKSLIRKAYFAAKQVLKSERGAVEIGKSKVERKRPWLTKSQKERRAKKKAIKEKQLKIENAKEAKEQIHGMIRDRRQNLNLSAYETNLFVNDIEQQTTKTQREVIPFIIEKTDIPESLNRPDLEKAYKKDKDNLAPIALQVKQHFDAGWLKMKENIPDMSAEQIENYVTHIWDLNKGQKRIVTNWFTTQNRFLKKRYIETLREGIEELGLTPKVLDISEIIRIHDGVASRAIENTKFVEGLKGLKYEGMPLIERADKAPQGWVYFDHPALRRGLVIPGKLKIGEKISPELSNLLAEMGVAIGRRISPVAFGKPVGKKGEYISGEPPEIRFQRFMSSRTVAHEIGHHLDEVLKLGDDFLNNYKSELYEINRERIESRIGEVGKYGEAYARSTEEQIAEFFATLFTDASKAYRIAPNATADALNRLRQDEVLSKLIDFDFEKQAKNLIEEQLNTLVKLPIKVHPDLEKPLKVVFESRIEYPAIQAYEVTNGILKKTNLSLSLFHHGALGETGIAIMGTRKVLNIYFNPVKIYKAMVQGRFDIFEKEPIARRWIRAGLQVGATADVPVNMIQSKLNNLARKTKNVPLINKTTEFIRTFNEVWDKALWNYLHDTLKLYACESLGTKIDPTKDMTKQEQEITQFVNDTFGGQNWDTLMISPKSLQIMTWSLLSADWTTSTVRQALSPTGIGRVHKETIGMRRKLGAYFWIKAGLYFGVGINVLNYTFREWDEKENPKYYEGMGKRTILDKTMAGNTMGHKTHLFVGRYEDGTERYIRWGKQFRELPELFFDDVGFSPFSATKKKVGGKLAPIVQLTSKIFTGVSPSGFRDDDTYGKKGWDWTFGVVKTLIKSPLPFATRTLFQEGKKFHLTDLAMPSSKGMTRWKSINLFKHAIIKRDDQLLKETYQFTLMNNLPAYTLFSTALTILKAESTKEFTEGIKTIEDVKKLLDKVDDPKDLIRLGNKYKRIQKESVDRKLGMDLLDQAIRDIKKYELIESE